MDTEYITLSIDIDEDLIRTIFEKSCHNDKSAILILNNKLDYEGTKNAPYACFADAIIESKLGILNASQSEPTDEIIEAIQEHCNLDDLANDVYHYITKNRSENVYSAFGEAFISSFVCNAIKQSKEKVDEDNIETS